MQQTKLNSAFQACLATYTRVFAQFKGINPNQDNAYQLLQDSLITTQNTLDALQGKGYQVTPNIALSLQAILNERFNARRFANSCSLKNLRLERICDHIEAISLLEYQQWLNNARAYDADSYKAFITLRPALMGIMFYVFEQEGYCRFTNTLLLLPLAKMLESGQYDTAKIAKLFNDLSKATRLSNNGPALELLANWLEIAAPFVDTKGLITVKQFSNFARVFFKHPSNLRKVTWSQNICFG